VVDADDINRRDRMLYQRSHHRHHQRITMIHRRRQVIISMYCIQYDSLL